MTTSASCTRGFNLDVRREAKHDEKVIAQRAPSFSVKSRIAQKSCTNSHVTIFWNYFGFKE